MRAVAITAALAALVWASSVEAREVLVRTQADYAAAAKAAQPGDTIVLADGEWRDFKIRLVGEGRDDAPITLTAQHPGKVVVSGVSSLRLAGRNLVVSNLVFKNGHAPDDELIAFRDGKRWAEKSRITGIVVDSFNQPDRRKEDHWVALYGSDNRVDHSHFEGKANAGAMMVVIREKSVPLDNRHRIDHVYFGPRPVLGSNGGETIRIGTSTESMSDSHTVVEDNYFERCDGEVEIVSVKSGANIVRRNTFVDSQGAVVLRHGNGNLVERNVFFGHGIARTGGVRVINERQTVRDNYLEGLGGVDFTGALTVMNGVPNGPINRYLPVQHALIERNSFIDVRRITLGAGADAERSQPPASTRLVANLVTGQKGKDPFRGESDLSGITATGNVLGNVPDGTQVIAIDARPVTLARAANGLLYPTDSSLGDVGAPRDLVVTQRDSTGVSWYPKPATSSVAFDSGRTIDVASGASLAQAVATAGAGDVLRLGAGEHRVDSPLRIDRTLTLAAANKSSSRLSFAAATLFQLENGARLKLVGLAIDGSAAPARAGNAVIRTSAQPMTANYAIEMVDCAVSGLDRAPGFDVIATTPATLGERIAIRGSSFTGVSGAVIAAHAETGKEGWYDAERIEILDSRFDHVGTIADIFRGGTDESTYGPQLVLTGSTIANSGPLLLSGVQEATITGNRFTNAKGLVVTHSVGTPHTLIAHNSFAGTPTPVLRELYYKGPQRAEIRDNIETAK